MKNTVKLNLGGIESEVELDDLVLPPMSWVDEREESTSDTTTYLVLEDRGTEEPALIGRLTVPNSINYMFD